MGRPCLAQNVTQLKLIFFLQYSNIIFHFAFKQTTGEKSGLFYADARVLCAGTSDGC